MAFASIGLLFSSCNKKDLENFYPDPSKSSTASVENFLTGVLASANEAVMPWYWRFFVVEQPTLGHYTQTMGWVNSKDQYIPPTAAMDWRWNLYYTTLTQYRVMENLYNNSDEVDQQNKKIFMLAAKIFFYDQTEQVVDLFGDIPWTEAGMVRNVGNLDESLPKYDKAEDIYATMLTDLKAINDELSTIQVPTFWAGLFQTKDYLNNGSILLWQKYCNSLRLRMLIRESDAVPSAATEIATILNNPAQNPVIESNDEAIMLDAGGPDLFATTSSKSGGIRQAMETWGVYDLAPYAMVKNMLDNNDPRLDITFDPNVNGEWIGVNPMLDATVQNQQISSGLVARYDTSSFTRNNYFPGFVITAAEVSFMKAEAYQKGWASGNAQAAYEMGIDQSIDMYFNINSTGDYRAPLDRPTAEQITAYKAAPGVSWSANTDKMALIATQKWINTGLGEMPQTWAEYRRLDAPTFSWPDDPTSFQKVPPLRWLYPVSEQQLNGSNYDAVKADDNLNTRIFWDTK
jgi:tetratricopeptide (TPR) repeat protein